MSELNSNYSIESLLSAKQLLNPQVYENSIYFLANFSGKYSLWKMERSGSLPVMLIPENIALQNPHLMNGSSFEIFPELETILIMIDKDGDENYQPMMIDIDGSPPKLLLGDNYANQQFNIAEAFNEDNIVFFNIDDRKTPGMELVKVNIQSLEVISYGKKPHGLYLFGISENQSLTIVGEGFGVGDIVVYLKKELEEPILLYGTPLDDRKPNDKITLNNFGQTYFVENNNAILFTSVLFSDFYGITWMELSNPQNIIDIPIKGLVHSGLGELNEFKHLKQNIYLLQYNIDGCSYLYEAKYIISGAERYFSIYRTVLGVDSPLNNGVLLSIFPDLYQKKHNLTDIDYVLAFTKATLPSQIFNLVSDNSLINIQQLSKEKTLGIPLENLSEGEDASFISFDNLRISARLYRPSSELQFEGSRPLILYVHGGPTSQERPDFTWFSMPLIQYLTLHGFAVLVPNVRGSTGYGFSYMNKVNRDWAGDDMKDHVEILNQLKKDPLIDSTRRGVVGRSYGGFMTLSLLSRHPEFWNAGVDMFGPYDLIAFYNRLPPSWQAIFDHVLGHPEKDRDFLIERSPKSYFKNIQAPLLVIQGANDPRVILEESKEIVESMKAMNKSVDLIVYEDEGHDVIKFKNKVDVYQSITKFFLDKLA